MRKANAEIRHTWVVALLMAAGAYGAAAQLLPIDTLTSYGMNAIAASKAWDRYKNSITRGPTYTAIGLEDAGINRILAAGGGIGAQVGQGMLARGATGGGPKRNIVSDLLQQQLMRSQTAKATSETDLLNLSKVKAQGEANFWGSPLGIQTIEDDARNKALPTTYPGGAIRVIDKVGEFLDKMPSASDPQDLNALRIEELNLPTWAKEAYKSIMKSERPPSAR